MEYVLQPLILRRVRHSRMLFSGNPGEIRTGPPIKTFGGDGLRSRISSLPPQFSKEDTKDSEIDTFESLNFVLFATSW
jgi:hypothetical protein